MKKKPRLRGPRLKQKARAGNRRSGGTLGALGPPPEDRPGSLTPEDGERRARRRTRRESLIQAKSPLRTSTSMEPQLLWSRRGLPPLQLRQPSRRLRRPLQEALPPRREERTERIRTKARVTGIREESYLAALKAVCIAIAAPDAGVRCVGCLCVQSALNYTWLNATRVAAGSVRGVATRLW